MATKIWVGTDTGNEGDVATAANWSPSGVPTTADDVVFENSSQSVTEGFNQSTTVLSSLSIAQSYTGAIGDSDEYLEFGASAVKIGHHYGTGSPAGSGRIKLDLGTASSVVTVLNSGTPTDANKNTIRLKAVSSSTEVHITKGSVGIASDATGETSTVKTIHIGYDTNKKNDADLNVGPGVGLTNFYKTGGESLLGCAATLVEVSGGELTTYGSGAVATMTVTGGSVESNSTGTITALNVSGGAVDFTKSPAARTVTTVKLEAGGQLSYEPDVLTITNKVDSDNKVTLLAT